MIVELTLTRSSHDTLQQQIVHQLREQILTGRLTSEFELPSSRDLSEQYAISRNTAIQAYEKLISEGYLITEKGVCTRVSPAIPDRCLYVAESTPIVDPRAVPPADRRAPIVFQGRRPSMPRHDACSPKIDFWPGRVNRKLFPLTTWRRLADEVLSGASSGLVDYGDPAGLADLRAAIAAHIAATRGVRCGPDRIVVTAGIQEGINLISRLFVSPGVGVVIENPGYGSAALAFESYGARLIPIQVDELGLRVSELPEHDVSLAYVAPSHQFPTGVSLIPERRQALLAWARRTGAYILEDDYDSDYNFSGPPLLSLAGHCGDDRVIYAGTLSKALGAGIRTGFLVLPEHLVEPAVTAKLIGNYAHPWLDQAILALFMGSGAYHRHLRTIRKACSELLHHLIERLELTFGNLELFGVQNGMHVMWRLPPDMPGPEELARLARDSGVGIYTLGKGGAFDCRSGYATDCVLLGYAALTEREITQGVEVLARIRDDHRRSN